MSPLSRQGVAAAMVLSVVIGPLVSAAQMPPAPVRYTQVREHPFRSEVTLPGTVESRTSSLVASEVAGLVSELLAREGDTVRRGQPVVRLRQQTLELRLTASRAALKEATARLELAERSLERSRELFDSGVISQQLLDDAVSESDAWQGRVEQNAANKERLEDDLERSSIPAPFTGVVVAEHVGVGEWVDVGDAVVEMVSLTDIEVVSMVPGRYLPEISIGQEVSVSFEALPGLEVIGRVSAVIPRADPQSRTFPVKTRIDNPGMRIGIGMLARVALGAGAQSLALIVPKDAVVDQGGGQQIFVIGDDETVHLVSIATGRGYGEWLVVEGDLRPGQKIVVRGNERLMPGQRVIAEEQEYELP